MNILLIDDEPLTLQMLQKKIPWQEIGIDQVYTANDTRFARQLLQTFSIQLLVCDIEMPGENGFSPATTISIMRKPGFSWVYMITW